MENVLWLQKDPSYQLGSKNFFKKRSKSTKTWSDVIYRRFCMPTSMKCAATAFTFKLLKLYNILHVEGKIAMYDFIGSIRRLTDNAFAHNTMASTLYSCTNNFPDFHLFIQDPYPQFRLVSRIWALLTSKRRQGHYHDIDRVFVPLGRQKGSLVVPCPACPDPGFNMEQNWELTPILLRYVLSSLN